MNYNDEFKEAVKNDTNQYSVKFICGIQTMHTNGGYETSQHEHFQMDDNLTVTDKNGNDLKSYF